MAASELSSSDVIPPSAVVKVRLYKWKMLRASNLSTWGSLRSSYQAVTGWMSPLYQCIALVSTFSSVLLLLLL